MSQGWRGEAFWQGQSTKCQRLNVEFLGMAVLCPIGLNRSLTRTETKLIAASARFCELFSLISVSFPVVEKALGSPTWRHEAGCFSHPVSCSLTMD